MLTDNEIRDLFFKLVSRLGWSDADVVRELDAPQSNVSKWRSGERKVPPNYLPAIAHRAGETPGYFGRQPTEELARVEKRDLLVIADWLSLMAASLRKQAGATSPAEDQPDVDEVGLAERGLEALPTATAPTHEGAGEGLDGSPAQSSGPNGAGSRKADPRRGKKQGRRRA